MTDKNVVTEVDRIADAVVERLDKRKRESAANRDRALLSTAALLGTCITVAWGGATAAIYAIPLSHEANVRFSAVDTESRTVTTSYGEDFKIAASEAGSVVTGQEYRCTFSQPLASDIFPFSSSVPTLLKGISGCEPTMN